MGRGSVIVLDTHAWIWWAGASPRLTPRAARAIEQADAVGIPAISCWELAMLVAKGRLALDREPLAWIRQALAVPRVELLQISPEIGVRAGFLDGAFHGDPADRLIVATALVHRVPVVSKDRRIRSFRNVRSIW